MPHHSRLVFNVGWDACLQSRINSCVCVQYFLHGTVCITAATIRQYSPQASSKPCLLATPSPPQRAWRACTVAVLVFEVPGQAGCQHLPEVAFWDVAAFQCLRESKHFMGSVFALSYRWLTAEHPDADGFPPVQGRRLLGGAQGGLREGGHQRGRLCGLLGLRLAVPARAPTIRSCCSARVCGRATHGTAVFAGLS